MTRSSAYRAALLESLARHAHEHQGPGWRSFRRIHIENTGDTLQLHIRTAPPFGVEIGAPLRPTEARLRLWRDTQGLDVTLSLREPDEPPFARAWHLGSLAPDGILILLDRLLGSDASLRQLVVALDKLEALRTG
ncbi:MAG: hypothetical protein PHI49_12650 [Halothiobacillaceae bacterium]|jgi:hypothetical protein|nr:hypothetical protein [Halothiobacillaceae bacterium]MDY0050506.1 hypothetical protein [Halothiobacillaceae bacterium]